MSDPEENPLMHRAAIASLVLTVVLAAGVRADETSPAEQVAALDWLEGTWRGPVGPGTWEAVYSSPSGGEVLSVNKEIRDSRAVSFEFERFFVHDGAVVMTPYVKGTNTVAFELTTLNREDRLAVFENPRHDFPQRIEYHRTADDRLEISVTAVRNGQERGFQLELARVEAAAPGGDAPPGEPAIALAEGAAAPAALLERLATAGRDRDHPTFLACIVPDERPELLYTIGVMLPQFALQMGALSVEAVEAIGDDAAEARTALGGIQGRFDALLAKYDIESLAALNPDTPRAEVFAPLAGVDQVAFLEDALAVLQPYWDENAGDDETVRNPLLKFAFEVKGIEERGDVALVSTPDDVGAAAVQLKRIGGRWFFSMRAPEEE